MNIFQEAFVDELEKLSSVKSFAKSHYLRLFKPKQYAAHVLQKLRETYKTEIKTIERKLFDRADALDTAYGHEKKKIFDEHARTGVEWPKEKLKKLGEQYREKQNEIYLGKQRWAAERAASDRYFHGRRDIGKKIRRTRLGAAGIVGGTGAAGIYAARRKEHNPRP